MAGPMESPVSARAGAAVIRGQAAVPGAVAAGFRTTQLWLSPSTADGEAAVGAISMGQATVGGTCSVVTHGAAVCLSDAAIAAQVPIAAGAAGGFKAATTGDIVLGWSRTAASGATEEFEAELGTPDAGRVMP